MIKEILKYDKYTSKQILNNNNDYKIQKNLIKNPEEKIRFLKNYLKEINHENTNQLAISLLVLIEKYKNEELILNNIKKLAIYTNDNIMSNESIKGAFIIPKPKNLFTNKEVEIKNPILIVKNEYEKKQLNNIQKQVIYLHELRHFITHLLDTDYYLDKQLWFQRTGLSQTIIFKKEDQELFTNIGLGIDEVTNVYQSEQLINTILSFKNLSFKDNSISNYLNSLKNPYKDGYKDDSYYFLSLLMAPLLNNSDFIQLTDYYALIGQPDKIEQDFNYLYGDYTNYISFIKNLDLFISLDEKQIIENKEEIQKLKKLILEMSATSKKL